MVTTDTLSFSHLQVKPYFETGCEMYECPLWRLIYESISEKEWCHNQVVFEKRYKKLNPIDWLIVSYNSYNFWAQCFPSNNNKCLICAKYCIDVPRRFCDIDFTDAYSLVGLKGMSYFSFAWFRLMKSTYVTLNMSAYLNVEFLASFPSLMSTNFWAKRQWQDV